MRCDALPEFGPRIPRVRRACGAQGRAAQGLPDDEPERGPVRRLALFGGCADPFASPVESSGPQSSS
jgi:hypothetical protein